MKEGRYEGRYEGRKEGMKCSKCSGKNKRGGRSMFAD